MVYALTTGMARRVARKPSTLMAALMTTEYRVRTSSTRKKAQTHGARQAAARVDSAAVLPPHLVHYIWPEGACVLLLQTETARTIHTEAPDRLRRHSGFVIKASGPRFTGMLIGRRTYIYIFI